MSDKPMLDAFKTICDAMQSLDDEQRARVLASACICFGVETPVQTKIVSASKLFATEGQCDPRGDRRG